MWDKICLPFSSLLMEDVVKIKIILRHKVHALDRLGYRILNGVLTCIDTREYSSIDRSYALIFSTKLKDSRERIVPFENCKRDTMNPSDKPLSSIMIIILLKTVVTMVKRSRSFEVQK